MERRRGKYSYKNVWSFFGVIDDPYVHQLLLPLPPLASFFYLLSGGAFHCLRGIFPHPLLTFSLHNMV